MNMMTSLSSACILAVGASASADVLLLQSFENPDYLGTQYMDATVDGGDFDHDLVNYDRHVCSRWPWL